MPTPRLCHRAVVVGLFVCIAAALSFPTSAIAADTERSDTTTSASGSDSAGSDRLSVPVLSARRLPSLLVARAFDESVRDTVDPVLDTAPENSCLVVEQGGRTIVDVRGSQAMVPASTLKLLTATAAMEALGADSRLQTVAAAATEPDGGAIKGDLYLIGGGDPLLTTEGYRMTFEDPDQAYNDFSQMADNIARAGVRRIEGGIVGDDSRYDTERWVSTWPTRYQRQDDVGPLSALMVNDGSTGLSLSPNKPAQARKAGDPPLLAAETLKTLLEDRGIEVTGDPSVGKAPTDHVQVAVLESLTIREIATELLVDSDNTTAELLAKEIGFRRQGSGSTRAGVEEIVKVAREIGLPTEGLALNDASGLDQDNRISCDTLAALITRDDGAGLFHELLPVAGETGTLRKRMRGTAAQGRVRAKTGSLNEVNALAGSVTLEGTEHLDFVYIVNGPEPRGSADLDDLAVALASVPAGPDLSGLVP